MKIYVGAGEEAVEAVKHGWTCNDLAEAAERFSPHITLVGPCWKLAVADGSVDEIFAKGMLEHLTYHEVTLAFAEWQRVLRPGGFVTVDVPDVIEYLRQYFAMCKDPSLSTGEGLATSPTEPQDFEVCSGLDRWLRRALWGWQRYPGDEHRSGWHENLLRFYLKKFFDKFEIRRMAYGFDEDVADAKMRHLWARAWK